MGSFDEVIFKTNPIRFDQGDTLILYTDGITDSRNKNDEVYGSQRFEECLERTKTDDTIQTSKCICEAIKNELKEYTREKTQFDDITLLAATYLGYTEKQYKELSYIADDENTEKAIDELNALLAKVNCPEYERRNLDVVMDEICANISDYASETNPVHLDITIEVGLNYAEIEFVDDGMQFNPLEVEKPDFTKEVQNDGRGICLVKQLVDRIDYKYDDNHNVLSLIRVWNIN